jgi:hypothetical protein
MTWGCYSCGHEWELPFRRGWVFCPECHATVCAVEVIIDDVLEEEEKKRRKALLAEYYKMYGKRTRTGGDFDTLKNDRLTQPYDHCSYDEWVGFQPNCHEREPK